jgi:Ulp1 family protease
VDAAIRSRVFQQVAESGVEIVLLPLNFQNAHWCCVVVSVTAKRIFYYDPLNQAPYLKSAMAIATHLKIAGLQDYDVIAQNNPIQFDAFSCGVYVCWMFIRHVAKGPPLDMSVTALPRRRFELFYYLLSGRLLPKEGVEQHDEEEEKNPAPLAAGNDNEEEDVPPTQVAK